MPDCQLRPAAVDAQSSYALICELKQAEFDSGHFTPGFLPIFRITACTISWLNWTGRSSA